jgi:inhibitor of KinA sporulation pathway (predicted exonuclease)
LDLEGKEILEFPAMLIDAKTLMEVDRFHCYCRPQTLPPDLVQNLVQNRYGRLGLVDKWAVCALPFHEVMQHFEDWLVLCGLLVRQNVPASSSEKESKGEESSQANGTVENPASPPSPSSQSTIATTKVVRSESVSFALVTCGNWDIRTQIPKQCGISHIALPSYFDTWVNLKDIFYDYYGEKALSMRSMLSWLNMVLIGFVHLGMHDVENIARIMVRMMEDGAIIDTTAQRNQEGQIEFKFDQKSQQKEETTTT